MPFATLIVTRSALRTAAGYLLTFDWGAQRHQLATLTISGTPTIDVLLAGETDADADSASTDLTVSGIVLDVTSKKVQCALTDVSATVGNRYKLVCTVTLSDGEVLPPEALSVRISGP